MILKKKSYIISKNLIKFRVNTAESEMTRDIAQLKAIEAPFATPCALERIEFVCEQMPRS